MFNKC